MSRRPNPNRGAHRDEPRPIPQAPPGLGEDGSAAWQWVWSPNHTWITSRHLGLAERYCRLRDVIALIFRQLDEDGVTVTGSTKQARSNTLLPQLKNLSTELRLCEAELGLTPAAESKTAAPTPTAPAHPVVGAKADRPGDTSLVTLLSDHRKRDGA